MLPVHKGFDISCKTDSSLSASAFSSPEFVEQYINFSSCRKGNFKHKRLKSYLGEQREIRVETDYTFQPEENLLCEDNLDPDLSVVYLVVNPSWEGRDRARRLWTSKVANTSLVKFLLLQNEGMRAIQEGEELQEDVIITNIKEDEEFAFVHLVNITFIVPKIVPSLFPTHYFVGHICPVPGLLQMSKGSLSCLAAGGRLCEP